MTTLNLILEAMEAKERRIIPCLRCGGAGWYGTALLADFNCPSCNGAGRVPNRWMKIRTEVLEAMRWIVETRAEIEALERKVSELDRESLAGKLEAHQLDIKIAVSRREAQAEIERRISDLKRRAEL